MKNLCEKYLEKERDLYVAFMDLEKVYGEDNRDALLRSYKYMAWEESH